MVDRRFVTILVIAGVLALGTGYSVARAGHGLPLHRALAEAMLSPGSINEAHADVACSDCHAPFRGATVEGCMSGGCHPKADLQQADPRAVAVHEKAQYANCNACHPEHRGRNAALTVAFHQSAPPAAQRDCVSCHRADGQDAHPEIKEERCAACHVSTRSWERIRVDHAQLSDRDNCASCHGQEAKDAHADIKDTNCSKCHKSTETWDEVDFEHKDIAGQPCLDCHAAPRDSLHAALGPDKVNRFCVDCHEVVRWTPAKFRHDVLDKATVGRCADCHKTEGRRAHPGITSQDCAACHVSTENWKRINFSHAKVSGQACTNCHRAPRGWLHESARGVGCQECHSTRYWEPSTFRHPRIPEFGEHMEALDCVDCHPRSLNQAVSCRSCHRGGFFDD